MRARIGLAIVVAAAAIISVVYWFHEPATHVHDPQTKSAASPDGEPRTESQYSSSPTPPNTRDRASAPAAPASILVRVRSSAGTAVAGAEVVLSTDDGELQIGVTDEFGVAQGPTRPDGIAWFADDPNGNRGCTEFDPLAREVTILVFPHRLLHGRIRSPCPIDATQVFVLARPRGQPPPGLDRIYAAIQDVKAGRRSRSLALVRAHPDGTFELQIDERLSVWIVEAGGGGVVGADFITWHADSRDELVVPLQACSGMVARLNDHEGAPLVVSTALGPTGRWECWTDSEHVRAIHVAPTVAVLAGIEPLWAENASDHLLLFFGSEQRDAPALAHVRLQYPGYERKECAVAIGSIWPQLDTVSIALRRIAESWGRVRIEATRVTPELDRAAYGRALLGELVLESELHGRFAFPLNAWDGDACTVDGIPTGTYRARFRSRHGPFCSPPPSDDALELVVEREPVTFAIDFSGMSVLSLEPSMPSLAPFAGELRLVVSEGPAIRNERGNLESRGARIVDLEGPPYVVGGWTPGRVTVRLLRPKLVAADGTVAVDAVAGRVSRVDIALADR